ncbi:hypothetical protein DL240_04645 [Lujinxingia litoralis]|uniref:SHOCT domain-containing protein n=1 Tax=Lujinxingia litoralis TaxID=2211119 RepID=A0A328CBE1_9DELT|nr:hypothetical protein [Lujinxingia litoralis]RAL25502.1 hypothetical protein DL240_04645 [Lujinxingia litoralis]
MEALWFRSIRQETFDRRSNVALTRTSSHELRRSFDARAPANELAPPAAPDDALCDDAFGIEWLNELDRLTAIHERGELTDDEYVTRALGGGD